MATNPVIAPTPTSAAATVAPAPVGRLATWRYVMNTANLPEGMTHPDAISKWLVITRAAVFSMTATSGLIGALLAVGAARLTGAVEINWLYLVLAVVGLVVAHAANNMINDYFDLEGGVDTDDYVRALYAPHPILSGWVTKRQLGAAILLVNAIDLAIMLFLTAARGPLVIAFALAGLFISVFYVAPPIRLKHIGLGEPGVFLVWGPLMVVGTFFVATGQIPTWTWVASLPYAILVTTVLFGKHIDKIDADTKKGVRTLPVILGERRARDVARILMIAFYPIVLGAVLVGWIGPWVALVVLGIPRLLEVLKTFASPRPETPPHSYVGWPLWFVGSAFIHTRRAGGLLVLGLLLNALLPIHLPWV
ncbi:MAG TPA: prenyltransferase [Verrucomicrobiae bacterium]|jgi:1,4-dihydroxy-2-naphthoate octaprenyltransferase|nr:prenyltransferase [Verrucomicrobiae bacterium]